MTQCRTENALFSGEHVQNRESTRHVRVDLVFNESSGGFIGIICIIGV